MEKAEKDTEKLILDAAVKVFTRKGFAGARTEDIAKEAGINRALLHYYFRDKQTMFDIIFETRFKEFFAGIGKILNSDQPLFDKIRAMIDHEINTLSLHPDLPRFVITEVASQPERLIQYGQKMGINPRLILSGFTTQVDAEAKAGKIKPIDSRQLLMNIMSLCIYPFIARHVIKTMMQLDESRFADMMEARKKLVYEMIIDSIKKLE